MSCNIEDGVREMDKYEFNIKVDQIRKLVNKGDYATAMKITDTIDWKKVRSANLLSMVSQVYEKNGEYQDAKDILLLAFERAPVGKRLLYKLTELALKEENMEEAEDYYREFCELSADDPRQYLLRFMILKQKGAPIEQLIHSLESYVSEELDEKWLYELAELYHEAGDVSRCVSTCDKIMLMFGLGKYVDKAMDLKIQYAPLTKYQMDLVENREGHEEKLRAVEESFQDMADGEDEYAGADQEQEPEGYMEPEMTEPEVMEPMGVIDGDSIRTQVYQDETEVSLKQEMSRMAPATPQEGADELGKTRILSEIHRRRPPREDVPQDEIRISEDANAREENLNSGNHLIIEARTPDRGLELAVEMLRRIQKETGLKNSVAKITGSKLNKRGVMASAEKLAGKDLMIEEAGDLSPEIIEELKWLMTQDATGIRVILIDNPRQLEMLCTRNPSLPEYFQYITDNDAYRSESPKESPVVRPVAAAIPSVTEFSGPEEQVTEYESEETAVSEPVIDDRPVRRVTPVRENAMRAPDAWELSQDTEPEDEEQEDEEEMDIDEFAQYACNYAAEIDCSVTGKSMLALYERIEIMEENGIPLNRTTAEELIEGAADRAEKPSIGKAIKGIFSSKYDKDGLLILKEEHFI